MLRRIALLTAIASISGCASILDEDGALAVVPYRVSSVGQIVIDARLNDEGPFSFAIDTGASITVVFDETRRAAGLEKVTDSEVSIQGMVASGHFPLVSARGLWVGGEGWTDARMASIPGDTMVLGNIDGILGVDFLRRYSVGLSIENKALRLYPPGDVRIAHTAVPLLHTGNLGEDVPLQLLPADTGDDGIAVVHVDIRQGEIAAPRS